MTLKTSFGPPGQTLSNQATVDTQCVCFSNLCALSLCEVPCILMRVFACVCAAWASIRDEPRLLFSAVVPHHISVWRRTPLFAFCPFCTQPPVNTHSTQSQRWREAHGAYAGDGDGDAPGQVRCLSRHPPAHRIAHVQTSALGD